MIITYLAAALACIICFVAGRYYPTDSVQRRLRDATERRLAEPFTTQDWQCVDRRVGPFGQFGTAATLIILDNKRMFEPGIRLEFLYSPEDIQVGTRVRLRFRKENELPLGATTVPFGHLLIPMAATEQSAAVPTAA